MIQRIKKSTSEPTVAGLTVPELIALNRQLFGGAQMKEGDDDDKEDDKDDDTDDSDDDADTTGDDGDDDDASGDDDKKGKKKGKQEDARIKELSDEAARHRRAKKAEKERADALQKRLDEIENKDKPEAEKLTARVTELETQNAKLAEDLHQARLSNAFLSSNKFDWHDPADALRLADLSEVELEDDGKVSGLDAALSKLAKAKPHLLKAKAKKQDDDADDDADATGHSPNGRKKKDGQLDRANLEKQYPALRKGRR